MKQFFGKIVFIKKDKRQILIQLFRIKLKIKIYSKRIENIKSVIIQNNYNLTNIRNACDIVVFLVPNRTKMAGGVMSIFSLCKYSREYCIDSECLISTHPGKYTYAINETFKNDEKVYRWKQIVKNGNNIKKLILHLPEYYADSFCDDLDNKDRNFLKNISDLQINIMNQNIVLMPEPEKLESLKLLTKNITQTIAHDRYATQDICNKWNIPTHLFSVFIEKSAYKRIPFEDKEKIIVLSPDQNEYKSQIVETLKKELSDFELVTVQNITYSEYFDLITKAYFSITFGEGFDGYFGDPPVVKSLCFAVYNDNFFPDKSWSDLKNVYSSYEEMNDHIVSDIKYLIKHKDEYENIALKNKEKIDLLYSLEGFKDNLKRFYEKNYDFKPLSERAIC
jgi:hypothetical protein